MVTFPPINQANKLRWKPDKNLVQIKWLHTTSSGASCSETEDDYFYEDDVGLEEDIATNRPTAEDNNNNCDDQNEDQSTAKPPALNETYSLVESGGGGDGIPESPPPELPPKMRSLHHPPPPPVPSQPLICETSSIAPLFSSMGVRAFSKDDEEEDDNDCSEISEEISGLPTNSILSCLLLVKSHLIA